jgi:hypothetical protein
MPISHTTMTDTGTQLLVVTNLVRRSQNGLKTGQKVTKSEKVGKKDKKRVKKGQKP